MHGLHLLKAIVKGRLAFQAVILDDLAQPHPTRSREGWQGTSLRASLRHHEQNPVFPFGVLGAMLRL